ncbi:dynein regulatory complex protein 10-like isoform X1 [Biomphalaria glabrata]|uniref:Dynein regulatory complex protein 10 n=2 Tax=Biomphalaria glabrata TaxID=6526 RepID=A0A9W2YGC6_BIOGL|nr:dynein regulatory complex protein 10-like isoform X1 [Biomphalaria glabrata]
MSSQTLTEVTYEPTVHIKLTTQTIAGDGKRNANLPLRIKTKSIKLDPTRALEPTRKKLSAIESQRIMAVFEDTIKRAEIVTAFPYILQNIDRFRISLGSELVDLLQKHSHIQSSYEEIRNNLDILLTKRKKQITKKLKQIALAKEEEEKKNIISQENILNGSDDYQNLNIEPSALTEVESSIQGDIQQDVADNTQRMVREEDEEEGRSSSAKSNRSFISDYEPRIEETMRNLGLVAQQISHSCKNILRLFNLNPTAINVISESCERNEGGQTIISNMQELRDILMHKLLTNPEEEKEREAYLDEISKRERHHYTVIEKLEKDLKTAIEDRDEEIRKHNEIIKRLQTELHNIEKASDENNRRIRLEAEKQEMADAKNGQQKSQKLQSEINALQSALNSSITEHREFEADLRAKKYKVENEVDLLIQKYDQELGERQDEYEEIDAVYAGEKKQLLELEERFATLEKEYLSIMEERRVARSKLERAQRELELVVKAATTIQAFWRSYKVRKALKAKAKKGGKKGGKKK